MSKHLVVVEDDSAIREMVIDALERVGYRVTGAANSVRAHELLLQNRPDLVLLDWMLPGTNGLEFAKRLKRSQALGDIPIIMLTAKGDEEERLLGFQAGVDDYVVKPFSVRELVARVEAVLRRSGAPDSESVLTADGLKLDPGSHRVTYNDAHVIRLGPTEFRLLRHFMSQPNRVFTRGHLLDAVWGRSAVVEERTVDVHVRRLRKALQPHDLDKLVQTVHGTGYRFSENPA